LPPAVLPRRRQAVARSRLRDAAGARRRRRRPARGLRVRCARLRAAGDRVGGDRGDPVDRRRRRRRRAPALLRQRNAVAPIALDRRGRALEREPAPRRRAASPPPRRAHARAGDRMSATDERLYKLLPAIYRLRDAANGEPLRALLAAMQQELGLLESDITDLYESWFIETCPEWVVPYIGDLLGVRGLFPVDNKQLSLRPYVGNTIRYRRRKGTASMLEGLARDATGGWPAAAVEYFQLLATNQNLNHVRWRDLRTPDLRDTNALELLGGPFERAARFAEVRRISVERGRYNIPNVGVFLWRLLGMSIHAAPAVADGGSTTRFRFDQLGLDAPLFGLQRSAGGTTRRVTESDVPGPLRPRALYEELNAVRAAETSGDPPVYAFFDPDQPVLEIAVFDPSQTDPLLQWPAIPSDRIQICDLGSGATWTAPTPLEFTPAGGSLTRC